MREIWPQLKPWLEGQHPFALATVVGAARPSPRGVGSVMAVNHLGNEFIGSVSAGCVEIEVIEAARASMANGTTHHAEYGGEHGFPWEVSMTCGGKVKIRVDPVDQDPDFRQSLVKVLSSERAAMHVTGPNFELLLNDGGEVLFEKGEVRVNLINEAMDWLKKGLPTAESEHSGGAILFRHIEKPARFFIIGAVHISIHLVGLAKSCGFETIVIDPREVYVQVERFPTPPDRFIHGWPGQVFAEMEINSKDCVAVITHDPKIDDDALLALLKTPCGYLGALGSRKNHDARVRRLSKKIPDADLSRLHGPIGLDIGSETPAEIAVSIMAEVIQKRGR